MCLPVSVSNHIWFVDRWFLLGFMFFRLSYFFQIPEWDYIEFSGSIFLKMNGEVIGFLFDKF